MQEAVGTISKSRCKLQEGFVVSTKSRCKLQEGFVVSTKGCCKLQEGFVVSTKGRCKLQEGFVVSTKASCKLQEGFRYYPEGLLQVAGGLSVHCQLPPPTVIASVARQSRRYTAEIVSFLAMTGTTLAMTRLDNGRCLINRPLGRRLFRQY